MCFEDDMLDNLLRSDRIILLKHCIENYLDERKRKF